VWGGWALTESLTLYYQPLHLTSFIFIVLLLLFYLYSDDVNKYYLTWLLFTTTTAATAASPAAAATAQIVLNRSQSGLHRSTGSASPVFGRTVNAGLKSSRMVLTGVGTTKVAKERQAPSTDSIWQGVADPCETKPPHWRQNPSSGYGEYVLGNNLSNASMFARVEVTDHTSEPHTNIGSILLDTLSITFTQWCWVLAC